jgi:hypothetical protein
MLRALRSSSGRPYRRRSGGWEGPHRSIDFARRSDTVAVIESTVGGAAMETVIGIIVFGGMLAAVVFLWRTNDRGRG